MPRAIDLPEHEDGLSTESFISVHPDGVACRVPFSLLLGELPAIQKKRHYGNGPPLVVVGATPGDEYVDISTGDLYELE